MFHTVFSVTVPIPTGTGVITGTREDRAATLARTPTTVHKPFLNLRRGPLPNTSTPSVLNSSVTSPSTLTLSSCSFLTDTAQNTWTTSMNWYFRRHYRKEFVKINLVFRMKLVWRRQPVWLNVTEPNTP